MKSAILTATKRYGGLDVTADALKRQIVQPEVWIIADELYDERWDVVDFHRHEFDFEIHHYKPRKKPKGWYSDLPWIYNDMAARAVDRGCDLGVSLQDYITVPDYGLFAFEEATESLGPCLITGLCSHLMHPLPEDTHDPKGLWSIWEEPFVGPKYGDDIELSWQDVRQMIYREEGIGPCAPQEWEMNWASFPLPLPVPFDESYGEHIGHENIQFAWQAKLARVPIFIQTSNHAFSVNHYKIFADEEAEKQPHLRINQERHNEKYKPLQDMLGGLLR